MAGVPRDTFHLQWHLTERCNLRCKHCYMDKELVKGEMGLGAVKDILAQYFALVRKWGMPREKSKISFTGGEPFVRKDIFDVLEECYKNHDLSRYGLLCNGFFLSDGNVARLKSLRVDYVQVSIEGKEKTNDSLRGKGSFRKAVEGIKRLAGTGIHTSVSMTVHKKNFQDVPAVAALTRELGVGTLGIRRLVPYGHGKALSAFMLSPQETREMFEYAVAAGSAGGPVHVTCGCEDGIAAQDMHYSPIGCFCGYHSLSVLPDGTVYACRRLPIKAGDLRKDSLEDVFRRSDFLEKIRDINNINDECRKCQFFNECLGGAKCVSFAYWGKLGGGDPQCWRRFDALPRRDTRWKISRVPRKSVTYY